MNFTYFNKEKPMTDKRDSLEGAREKMAQREYELHTEYYLKKYGYHKWENLPPIMRKEIYCNANCFLSLPVSSGGVCPECKGKKITPETGRGSDGFIRCETCNGTGYTIVTKELREIIKEWEDAG